MSKAPLHYRFGRGLDRLLSGSAIILLYHRVVEGFEDPQLLAVTPEHFSEHLEVLARHCVPTRLDSVPVAGRATLSRPVVAVTFDDGYADNLFSAKPALERHGVPATIFVSSRHLDGTGFWWDELAAILLESEVLPPALTCRVGGAEHGWTISDGADPYRRWDVLQPVAGDRGTAYKALCAALGGVDAQERERVLDAVAGWAGASRETRVDRRPLAADELLTLANGGLVDIGGHTATHPRLSDLPLQAQLREMREGKAGLEAVLGRPITMMSYPFGGPTDFTSATMALARMAGFTLACANYPGRVHPFSLRLALPRFLVRDWDGDEFEARLRGWLYG